MSRQLETIFLAAINNNKNKIFRICGAYSGLPQEAEDLFQEVLLNIWISMKSFQKKSSIDTWIYRITLNVCLRSQQKETKRKQTILSTDKTKMETLQFKSPEKNRYEELYHCIRSLNETDRSLIILFLEDLAYKEIAEITGLTESNIAVKIYRIKSKLFNCLKTEL